MNTIALLSQLDPGQQYTYADYLTWTFPERVELIDGYYRLIPPHLRRHQEVLGDLAGCLYAYTRAHKLQVFMAPFDVRLPTAGIVDAEVLTVVQPDLSVFLSEAQLDDAGAIAPPYWVVEIIQPGNFHHDTQVKFALYERHQVPEYWIISSHLKTIVVYLFIDGRYQPQGEFYEPVPVHTLPGLSIEWAEVFGRV